MIKLSNDWKDYKCLLSGDGEKLEKWGDVVLRRPDPQIIWKKSNNINWDSWDGFYHRSSKGGGNWEFRCKLPDSWTVNYKILSIRGFFLNRLLIGIILWIR